MAIVQINLILYNRTMREIKFRAWHTLHQKMYNVLRLGSVWYYHLLEWKWYEDIWEFSEQDCIIMQYTWLKDKNDTWKEIYFDDIVHIYWYWDLHIGDLWDVCQLYEALAEWDVWEIKGNIFENPELIS